MANSCPNFAWGALLDEVLGCNGLDFGAASQEKEAVEAARNGDVTQGGHDEKDEAVPAQIKGCLCDRRRKIQNLLCIIQYGFIVCSLRPDLHTQRFCQGLFKDVVTKRCVYSETTVSQICDQFS